MGYIYKIINIITKQIYIGQTRNDLYERWRNHFKKNNNCRYLSNAIQKYGKNNFKFELVIICFDEDLNYYEAEYIKKYNSLVPNGYNLKGGGNASNHHEETKIKIGNTLRGRKTNNKSMLGKHHSEEIKSKISNKLKGIKPKNFDNLQKLQKKQWKPVIQKDEIGNVVQRFESSVQAGNSVKSNKGSIHNACKKNILHKGYYWQFENN